MQRRRIRTHPLYALVSEPAEPLPDREAPLLTVRSGQSRFVRNGCRIGIEPGMRLDPSSVRASWTPVSSTSRRHRHVVTRSPFGVQAPRARRRIRAYRSALPAPGIKALTASGRAAREP